MDDKEKVEYLKTEFDKFLKDNNAFEAWYERYRLDNLLYDDDIPVEKFIKNMIDGGEEKIHSMLYYGIGDTVFLDNKDFFEENKRCDILSNLFFTNLDGKWMDNWRSFIDLDKLK